jgi:alpha-tubulin suppressor-like RCC1 family protein
MLGWGANSYGQLGLGHTSELEAKACRVPLVGEQVQAVVGGGGHTLALDKRAGHLFACGWNRFGQLGLGETEESVTLFRRVESVEGVADIAAGWDFSLVLLANGTVLASGSNRYGQLGKFVAFFMFKTIPLWSVLTAQLSNYVSSVV